MQHVPKSSQPQILMDFIKGQYIDGQYVNCNYNCLDTVTKRELKRVLLDEQGHICCYTGHQIDFDGSHIEHVKPQSQCDDMETLDYANMIAAYPKNSKCEYGAKARNDKHIPITPLQSNCVERFRYLSSGEVEPFDKEDKEAAETIQVLVLDQSRLKELRKTIIDEAIYQVLSEFPTEDQRNAYIEILIQYICTRDKENRLRAFCFVIRSAALQLSNGSS